MRDPRWEQLTRDDAWQLQEFTCTTEPPRTPGGRRLPHPRPWEWEAQCHLRRVAWSYRQGDVLLVARDASEAIGAAAHLVVNRAATLLEVFIASLAVSTTHRGKGGTIAEDGMYAFAGQHGLDSVSPHSSWARRLHGLVAARPPVNLAGMGIPERWAAMPSGADTSPQSGIPVYSSAEDHQPVATPERRHRLMITKAVVTGSAPSRGW